MASSLASFASPNAYTYEGPPLMNETKSPTVELDALPDIHDTVRDYIVKVGVHYGYNVEDFDSIVASFNGEPTKEDFLQELYDALPKEV